MQNRNFNTLVGTVEALSSGECSISEAVSAQLSNIPYKDPSIINRFDFNIDSLSKYNSYDKKEKPLAGIVLAHKDIFMNTGYMPGCGHDHGVYDVSIKPAYLMKKLCSAGAINAASLTMSEWACGATSENMHFPDLINPIDNNAVVGGSSSGSAVSVASGHVFASLGTDTLGSVRIPAATCGLVGFKPSHGVLPVDGVMPLAPTLDTVGIIGKDIVDVHYLFDVLTDSLHTNQSIDNYKHKYKIGVLINNKLDEDVGAALTSLANEMSSYASVSDVHINQLRRIQDCAQVIFHVEAFNTHLNNLQEKWSSLTSTTKSVIAPGAVLCRDWYIDAIKSRNKLYKYLINDVMGERDFIVLPAFSRVIPNVKQVNKACPEFDVRAAVALFEWMPLASYLGLPAIVFPYAIDKSGRPISVQIVGKRGSDKELLSFSKFMSNLTSNYSDV